MGLRGIGSIRSYLFKAQSALDKQIRHLLIPPLQRVWTLLGRWPRSRRISSLVLRGIEMIMTQLLRQRSCRIAIRSLATAAPASAPTKPSFTSTLDKGPSLDDFVAGNLPERVVLGNAKTCVLQRHHPGHNAKSPLAPAYHPISRPQYQAEDLMLKSGRTFAG